MPKLKDMYKIIESAIDAQAPIGKGIDVVGAISPNLKEASEIAAGPMVFKDPLSKKKDLGAFVAKDFKDGLSAFLYGTGDKQSASLQKKFGQDSNIDFSLNKDNSGSSVFLRAGTKFKKGGLLKKGKPKIALRGWK